MMLAALMPGGVQASAPVPRGYELTLAQGSRLLIAATVNGVAVTALLDSAAESTILDRTFARRLKLHGVSTVTGQGSGKSTFDADIVNGVRLSSAGLTLRNQTVAVADLSDVGKRLLGRRLDIILGRELFDAARIRIDVDGHRLEIVDASAMPRGVRVELTTEAGIESMPVKVEDGATVLATFDLGNGGNVRVGQEFATRAGLLTDGRAVKTENGGGLGGETVRSVVRLRSIEVAGQRFIDVPAAVDAQPNAASLNLGVSILRHFIITTDFAHHALWLEPRT